MCCWRRTSWGGCTQMPWTEVDDLDPWLKADEDVSWMYRQDSSSVRCMGCRLSPKSIHLPDCRYRSTRKNRVWLSQSEIGPPDRNPVTPRVTKAELVAELSAAQIQVELWRDRAIKGGWVQPRQ